MECWVISVVAIMVFLMLSCSGKRHKKKNMKKQQMICAVDRVIEPKENMSLQKEETEVMKTTETGYINKNDQRNNGRTNKPGTGNGQWFYEMECLKCGYTYYANGHDIWLRKCPKCQGGRP